MRVVMMVLREKYNVVEDAMAMACLITLAYEYRTYSRQNLNARW
jgi:hypothetical protein